MSTRETRSQAIGDKPKAGPCPRARRAPAKIAAAGEPPRTTDAASALAELALSLFLEHGYDATPMSQVAERAGLTKAGVYHHFESKEHLLYVVHKRHIEQLLLPMIDAAEREPDPEKRLRSFLGEYALLQTRDPSLRLLINETKRLLPAHQEEIREAWRRGLHLVRNAIAELQRQRSSSRKHDPTHAAFAAIGMCSWICNWFDYQRPAGGPAVARTMIDIFLNGLLLPPARKRGSD